MTGRSILATVVTVVPFLAIPPLPILLIDCGGAVDCAGRIVGSFGAVKLVGVVVLAVAAALAMGLAARRIGRSPLLLCAIGAGFGIGMVAWIGGDPTVMTPLAMAMVAAGIVAALVHLAVTVRPLRKDAEPGRSEA